MVVQNSYAIFRFITGPPLDCKNTQVIFNAETAASEDKIVELAIRLYRAKGRATTL
jgi:hypothetical protein